MIIGSSASFDVDLENDLQELEEEGIVIVVGEETADEVAEALATKCSRCGNSGNCSGSCNR